VRFLAGLLQQKEAHIFHRAALMVSTGRSLRTTRAEELEMERARTLLQTFRVCPTQTLGEGCWLAGWLGEKEAHAPPEL
jgi:hypothetical protein